MSDPTFIFAGGGTGGHLYPGLAVADALVRRAPAARICFFTTNRQLDQQLLRDTPYTQCPQPVAPLALHPQHVWSFFRAYNASERLASDWISKHKPTAVLGLGGYAAGPPVAAARRRRVRAAILNPDALPGRANRWLARRCDAVFSQWPIAHAQLPRRITKLNVGCPIRNTFAHAHRATGCERFNLDPDRPILLATGASQGARTINQALQRAWPEFSAANPTWQLLHLTGPTDEAETRAAYERAAAPATVLAFTEHMAAALAAADLVISRAGASTLAELTALGRPSILLPYPFHKDQHQLANANQLADVGAAEIVIDEIDPARNAPRLLRALEHAVPNRTDMAAAARALAKPAAADHVAEWLLNP